MNAASDTLIDKIRKLLAKAEATDNAHEAEAFSAKAAQLIAAHRVDPDHVAEATTHGRLGLRRIAIGRGAYVRARLALLSAVARHQDCEVVFETTGGATTAIVAGYEADLDVMEVLYTSLHAQAASQMTLVRRSTPAATQRWRRSFLFGFAERVAQMLGAARDAAARTAPPSAGDGSLPAVPAREAQVRRFAASAFGRVVAARPPAPAQASAWRDGHRAAGGVDLGRSRIMGRPALPRGGQ